MRFAHIGLIFTLKTNQLREAWKAHIMELAMAICIVMSVLKYFMQNACFMDL